MINLTTVNEIDNIERLRTRRAKERQRENNTHKQKRKLCNYLTFQMV